MPDLSKPQRFLATIYKIWMLRHVDVPKTAALQLQKQMAKSGHDGKRRRRTSYIPVVAIVNGRSASATLVPAGGGRFRMHINTTLRKAAGVDAGDVVSVELRLDRSSRNLPVPADLRATLAQHPKAEKAFRELATGHRRHFIQWFDSAKSAEARKRRLERAIDILVERALLRTPIRKQKRASRSNLI
jgi:hypothetical protein